MRFLGEYLAGRGFRSVGIRLPGHGLDPHELERAHAMDWLNAARSALFELTESRQAFVAGSSMGSLIGALLAAHHPERVAALALCSPPVRLRLRPAAMLAAAGVGFFERSFRFLRKGPSGLTDAEMRAIVPRLSHTPLRAAAQFDRIRALARLALPRVKAPGLVVYSPHDRVIAASSARATARLLGAQPVRMVRLERSSHVVTLDVERQRVAEEIERFFRVLR